MTFQCNDESSSKLWSLWISLTSFTFVVNMERRNCCWRPPSKPGLDMNRNQQTTNYKLSITNYLHLSCNDRDKGAEVTFTLQSLGGSGGPTFQHHCVSFSGGSRIFLLLSPLFHDGHIFNIIVFITTIVYSDISDQHLQEWCERYMADLVLQENLSPSIIWFLAITIMMIVIILMITTI